MRYSETGQVVRFANVWDGESLIYSLDAGEATVSIKRGTQDGEGNVVWQDAFSHALAAQTVGTLMDTPLETLAAAYAGMTVRELIEGAIMAELVAEGLIPEDAMEVEEDEN